MSEYILGLKGNFLRILKLPFFPLGQIPDASNHKAYSVVLPRLKEYSAVLCFK
jgi:hypothetical protein